MFLKSRRSHDRHGQQRASGRFLILVQPKGDASVPPRALVRHTALSQCGHFMMGVARVYGQSLTLSGAYGGDGLPVDVSRAVYDKATPLPESLYEAWKLGGGWNDAGTEAPAMRDWAIATFEGGR